MGMTAVAFKMGDKVRSSKRPEWGEGSVMKLEAITFQGKADQRIYVRFSAVGMKTLLASAADLLHADGAGDDVLTAIHRPTTLADVEKSRESGWLGAIDRRGPEEVMTSLPPAATDPFLSLRKRPPDDSTTNLQNSSRPPPPGQPRRSFCTAGDSPRRMKRRAIFRPLSRQPARPCSFSLLQQEPSDGSQTCSKSQGDFPKRPRPSKLSSLLRLDRHQQLCSSLQGWSCDLEDHLVLSLRHLV